MSNDPGKDANSAIESTTGIVAAGAGMMAAGGAVAAVPVAAGAAWFGAVYHGATELLEATGANKAIQNGMEKAMYGTADGDAEFAPVDGETDHYTPDAYGELPEAESSVPGDFETETYGGPSEVYGADPSDSEAQFG